MSSRSELSLYVLSEPLSLYIFYFEILAPVMGGGSREQALDVRIKTTLAMRMSL